MTDNRERNKARFKALLGEMRQKQDEDEGRERVEQVTPEHKLAILRRRAQEEPLPQFSPTLRRVLGLPDPQPQEDAA